MNNLQVSMNHKRITIDNNIAIDFMEKFPNKLKEFFYTFWKKLCI